jgi:excisionase family DNA binding protein
MTGDIMTIKDLAEYLKLNEKIAYRLVSERKISGFKVGGLWRFRKSDIET